MPVIDIMLSCKTQIKTQRYITNDDKKHLKMHQAIEKQYSYMMQKIPNTGFCIIISINRVMTAV